MAMRTATVADAESLVTLWEAAGLTFDRSAVAAELAALLEREPLVLVQTSESGEIIGAVLGTFDGRRGWVNRLAVRQDMRGRGIAAGLMAELERRLADAGCRKVNLLVEPANAGVTGFYTAVGYSARDLMFMQKWLPRGWSGGRDLAPELSGEPYVYTTAASPPPAAAIFAAILEDEGLTLVMTRADADMAGLHYSYVAARITLRVNSTLDEVGLTATVSRTLADAGISCNVIAGSAHDHLFVDWHRREQALDLLRQL
jgi:GNAT superfamily N-acetyltransferase